MTTDTAVRVTRMVVEEQCKFSSRGEGVGYPLSTLPVIRAGFANNLPLSPSPDTLNMVPYVDHPELKFNDKESTQMPFRYVTDKDGKPIMPEVRRAPASPLPAHQHAPPPGRACVSPGDADTFTRAWWI